MNNLDLYKKLILEIYSKGYSTADEKSRIIFSSQKKELDSLLKEIAFIMLNYNVKDSSMSLSMLDRELLNKKIDETIRININKQYDSEKQTIENILNDVIENNYYLNAYVMKIGINFKLQKIKETEMLKIVRAKVGGELWSKRLWNNKKLLQQDLQSHISNFLNGKIDVNRIKKSIEKEYGQNAYNSKRLVQTEVARCQDAANEVFAKKHEVQWQMFMATLDLKTSEKCRELDGSPFKIDDPNKPKIPRHPFCRSCMINLPNKDWKPSSRMNNIEKESIDYAKYEDWYKKNVI